MKNSKKKLWMSLGGIAISMTMLGATALAATDSLAGYNKFKELIIDTAVNSGSVFTDNGNSTFAGSFTLKKDGVEIATLETISKNHTEDGTTFSSSKTTTKSNYGEFTNENWTEYSALKNSFINKGEHDGKYTGYVWNYDDPIKYYDDDYEYNYESYETSITPAQERLMNALIDLVAGDTKSQFRTNGNVISISLEGAQIPEIGQLALSVLEEEMKKSANNYSPNFNNSDDHFSMIMTDIGLDLRDLRLEVVKADLEITDNVFNSANFEAVISGVDANGVRHTLSIAGNMTQSDIGTTTAEKINLDDIEDKSGITIENASDFMYGIYPDDIMVTADLDDADMDEEAA